MSARLILVAFAVGVIGLSIALFAPQAIDPVINDLSDTTNVTEGEQKDITERLVLETENVDQGGDQVNVSFLSTKTRNVTTTGPVNVSNSTTVTLDGDSITFTPEEITGSTTADVTVEYPALFGWDDGPRTFVENLDIMLMIVFAALAVALAVIGVKSI